MDSDDLFYDCFSCISLYYTIESEKYDVVSGQILEINGDSQFIWDERFDVLHAKIYRRTFLTHNEIHFPNAYNSEDEAFNNMVLINKPKKGMTQEITYVYRRRDNSLTTQNDYFTNKHIKAVCENLEWIVNEASKKKKDKEEIANVVVSSFGYLYYYFYGNMKDKNLKYVYNVIPIYKKYIKYISDDKKREIIVRWVSVFEKFPIDLSFEEFIKKIKNNK